MKIRDTSIVKIAVESDDLFPKLIEFNQKQPLATIIQELCTAWELSQPDQYALQFSDNNRQSYVTEKNRNEIKNGVVLRLTFSPSKTAQDILSKLNTGSTEDKAVALQQLSKHSTDMTFALEFINKQGLALIINVIEQKKYQDLMLAYCLQSFTELMDHGIVSWDILESSFIVTVAGYVNNRSKTQEYRVIEAALSILESIVLNSTGKYAQVEKQVTFPNLVFHLENTNPVVQQNAIALINALFSKADASRRKEIAGVLWSEQVRGIILTKIIETSADQVRTVFELILNHFSFSIIKLFFCFVDRC